MHLSKRNLFADALYAELYERAGSRLLLLAALLAAALLLMVHGLLLFQLWAIMFNVTTVEMLKYERCAPCISLHARRFLCTHCICLHTLEDHWMPLHFISYHCTP